MSTHISNVRPQPDQELVAIADYVYNKKITSTQAYETACYSLMDSLGCAFLALNYPACTKLLGPVVPESSVSLGVHIPGTSYILDPSQGAFNIGTMIRWLDYNDTWLAAEWGHPSDNLGAILAVAEYVSQKRIEAGQLPYTIRDVLTAMIQAHEIQGVLALQNSFNRVGLDHVVLVKIASTALSTFLFGGTKDQIINALSQAFVDGQSLRTYRHAPNTGSRKSWAAGDACRRAVQLALITLTGEIGYPSALTAKTWGFYDVLFRGKHFEFERGYDSYVMENVLFKISYPAEFHAQTAVECAIKLHGQVHNRLDDIERVEITTHESAIRIIDKQGPLHNPADRDHCIQYMTAIGLLFGDLTADHYEDRVAKDPRIDHLREKIVCIENKQYSKDYLDHSKRSIANAVEIFFKNGEKTEKIEIEYPIGHRKRRQEGIPLLIKKFENNTRTIFADKKIKELCELFKDRSRLEKIEVPEFMSKLWKPV